MEPSIGAAHRAVSRGRGPGAQQSIDALITALAPAAWGATYYVTTEHLPPERPLFTATVRALPVGLAIIISTRRLPVGAWWWRTCVLGTLNIGGFLALLFVAAYRLPSGIVATLTSVLPLAVTLLAWPVLGQRPRPRALLLTILCMAGVALVGSNSEVELDPLGILAALLAALVLAFGTVLTKRWGRPVSLLVFTGWQLTIGGLLLLPLAIVAEGAPPINRTSARSTRWPPAGSC